jgi:hypothetical protein
MAGKKTAVFGIYQNAKQADRTVEDLLAAGFTNDDISVLLPDTEGTRDFAHDKSSKAPEGTAAGVTTGGVPGVELSVEKNRVSVVVIHQRSKDPAKDRDNGCPAQT